MTRNKNIAVRINLNYTRKDLQGSGLVHPLNCLPANQIAPHDLPHLPHLLCW